MGADTVSRRLCTLKIIRLDHPGAVFPAVRAAQVGKLRLAQVGGHVVRLHIQVFQDVVLLV